MLILAYLFLISLFIVGSAMFYAYSAVWISPVPMAIGTAFEVLTTGSVHATLKVVGQAAPSKPHEPPRTRLVSKWQGFVAGAPTVVAAILVTVTIFQLQGWLQ